MINAQPQRSAQSNDLKFLRDLREPERDREQKMGKKDLDFQFLERAMVMDELMWGHMSRVRLLA
jgi:hypothetical protein